MRQVQLGKKGEKPRKKKTEPLAEGIGKRRPNGFFTKMSDDELIRYAKGIVKETGSKNGNQLKKVDNGLVLALTKRKLLDRVGLEKRRSWASMSDDEVLECARRTVEESGLKARSGLQKADSGLHKILHERKLIERIFPESAHHGRRNWASMSDDELVEYVRGFIEENEVQGRSGLMNADLGLYQTLRERRLLDTVFPETSTRRPRWFFTKMGDDELVDYAKAIIEKKGIRSRAELMEVDSGLASALRGRGLLDEVIAAQSHRRDWKSMSDEEIISFAKEVLKERAIAGRTELFKAVPKLYSILIRRELLDVVFAPLDSEQQKQAVQDVVDAMKEFDLS